LASSPSNLTNTLRDDHDDGNVKKLYDSSSPSYGHLHPCQPHTIIRQSRDSHQPSRPGNITCQWLRDALCYSANLGSCFNAGFGPSTPLYILLASLRERHCASVPASACFVDF